MRFCKTLLAKGVACMAVVASCLLSGCGSSNRGPAALAGTAGGADDAAGASDSAGTDANGSAGTSGSAGASESVGTGGEAGVDAGTSGGAGGRRSAGPDGAGLAARIEISPAGLVLRPDDSATLSARVLDESGALLDLATLTWEANGPAVTLAPDASGSTTVTAGAEVASAQVVARLGDLESPPVTIAVAEPVGGARVVHDEEVLTDVAPVDAATSGIGSQLHVVIAGDAPSVGEILVGVGKPVAGRVVASTPVKAGNDVSFELIPLDEVFANLDIDQRYDAQKLALAYPTLAPSSSSANADGSVSDEFVLDLPAYTPSASAAAPSPAHLAPSSARGVRAAKVDVLEKNFRLGPMYCTLAASVAPSISASQLSTTIRHNVQLIDSHISIGPEGASMKVLAEGSIGAQVHGPLRLSNGLDGSLGCQAPLLTWLIPVPPPVAVAVVPALIAGARINASGTITLNSLELVVDADAAQPLKLGFGVDPSGSFTNLSELDLSQLDAQVHPELRSTTLESPGRVDVSMGGGLFAQAAVTNIAYAFVASINDQYPYLSMLDLQSGLKANLRLGTVADQVNDPAYQAGYDVKFATRFGLGADAATVLGMLSKLLKLGSALIPDLTDEKSLFSSPLAVGKTSLTTYGQGEHLHFEVELDPDYIAPPLLGYYNVERIEVWRKGLDGSAEMLVGRDALEGDKEFKFDWEADRIGVGDTLIAIVEPVFGEGFKFKLGPLAGWSGTRQLGGPSDELASMLAVGPDDDVAIAGFSLDALGSIVRLGGVDAMWQKLDAAGQVTDGNLIGGLGDDNPLSMARSADGFYYLTGRSTADLDGTGAPASVFAWLIKLDAHGKKVWARQWATREQERATDVALGPSGEIYVSSDTGIAVNGASCPSPATDDRPEDDCGDAVLSKFGPGGNLLYRRVYERKGWQAQTKLTVDPSGSIVLAAQTLGNVETNELVGNEDPAFSVNDPQRYKWGAGLWVIDETSGDERTSSYFKIEEHDLITGEVASDTAGNVTLIGYTDGAPPGLGNRGADDAIVMQVSSLGSLNWARMFGTAAADSAAGLCIGPNNDIYIGGYSAGALFGPSSGGRDAFVTRLTSTGDTVWSRQFGTSANESAIALALDQYGALMVAGATEGKISPSLPAAFGGLDAFVAKFSSAGTLQ